MKPENGNFEIVLWFAIRFLAIWGNHPLPSAKIDVFHWKKEKIEVGSLEELFFAFYAFFLLIIT